jgi:hypothetical protein
MSRVSKPLEREKENCKEIRNGNDDEKEVVPA